jgi:hypothetical protein
LDQIHGFGSLDDLVELADERMVRLLHESDLANKTGRTSSSSNPETEAILMATRSLEEACSPSQTVGNEPGPTKWWTWKAPTVSGMTGHSAECRE